MTKPTHESFAAESQAIAAQIRAEEERARKIALEIEGRKRALLERGYAHYAAVLDDLREQTIGYLEQARTELAALGPAPSKPEVCGCAADFVAACEQHDRAVEAHRKEHERIAVRCHRACQALQAAASAARLEARKLGLQTPEGLGLIPEHVRRHARYAQHVDWLAGELGYPPAAFVAKVDVALLGCLIEALREPEPEPQAPNPTYPAGVRHPTPLDVNRAWRAVEDAAREPVRATPSQTLRDADRVMSRTPEEQRHAVERQNGIRP